MVDGKFDDAFGEGGDCLLSDCLKAFRFGVDGDNDFGDGMLIVCLKQLRTDEARGSSGLLLPTTTCEESWG